MDREFPGSISTRKLVIETAKFNVITAYDEAEALDCLRRFPKVDGVVVNADMADDGECRKLIDNLRAIVPNLDVIVISLLLIGDWYRLGSSLDLVASAAPPDALSKAFPEIQQSGATVVGQGKPGFPGVPRFRQQRSRLYVQSRSHLLSEWA